MFVGKSTARWISPSGDPNTANCYSTVHTCEPVLHYAVRLARMLKSVTGLNSSLDGAHSGKMAACCQMPIVRWSLCECQLDARIAASKCANLLQMRKVKVICGGWKTDNSVDQSDQRTEHSDFSSSTVQTCESLLLLHRGRILKYERRLWTSLLFVLAPTPKTTLIWALRHSSPSLLLLLLLLLLCGPGRFPHHCTSAYQGCLYNPALVTPFTARHDPRQKTQETSSSERRNFGREMSVQL
jgi:hypothetical protein